MKNSEPTKARRKKKPATKSLGGVVKTERHYSKAGDRVLSHVESQPIEIRTFVTPPANVSVTMERSWRVEGDGELRVKISAQVPAYVEELEEARLFVTGFVTRCLESEAQEVEAQLGDDS